MEFNEVFADLGLSEPLLAAVAEAGYEVPTPIQQKAIPLVLRGVTCWGCAQTGTGKTASYATADHRHFELWYEQAPHAALPDPGAGRGSSRNRLPITSPVTAPTTACARRC